MGKGKKKERKRKRIVIRRFAAIESRRVASFLDFCKKEHYAKRIRVKRCLPDLHFAVIIPSCDL